jgi:hypothetical protein
MHVNRVEAIKKEKIFIKIPDSLGLFSIFSNIGFEHFDSPE